MEKLIRSTSAYRIFCREAEAGRLAHAYMLTLGDPDNLRSALKIFAARFFGAEEGGEDEARVMRETFPDMRVYPEPGKKFNAEEASGLTEDSAMRPSAGDRKLYVISGIDECSAIVQNKLLKVIEEPMEGVFFILGACSQVSVLPTVISRVRVLEIPPFTTAEIFGALERMRPGGALNMRAAETCAGVLGTAQRLSGGGLEEITGAAADILAASDTGEAGEVSLKYANAEEKRQILAECRRMLLSAAKAKQKGLDDEYGLTERYSLPALIRGSEIFGEAMRDLKFNAYFPALLYDVLLKLAEENDKWRKLSE